MYAKPLHPEYFALHLQEAVAGFSTVLADPPWRFANRTGKVASDPYFSFTFKIPRLSANWFSDRFILYQQNARIHRNL
jgi:hypothetical protein